VFAKLPPDIITSPFFGGGGGKPSKKLCFLTLFIIINPIFSIHFHSTLGQQSERIVEGQKG
jgi:hypothetical protein